MLSRARLRIRSLLLRRRLEREMQEEMSWHLEQAAARLVARGHSAEDARHQAMREFGNVGHLQEQARDARGATWLDALLGDLRFALRHFARTPGTTAIMFIVLVAGLVISTLLFTYVHAYAYHPPPGVELADDLVRIRGSRDAGAAGRGYRHFAEEEFLEYRALGDHFEAVAGWTDANVIFGVGNDAERHGREARLTFVTENYFSVLDVRPALGAGLPLQTSDDPAAAAIAVIGHVAWVELFGRDPGAIGSTLVVNDVPVTIIGVAPERFTGFPGQARVQLWMPLSSRHLILREPSGEFRAVARLRDGVTMRAATAATEAVAARVAESSPAMRAIVPSADVVPLLAGNSDPMFERDVRLLRVSIGLLALLVLLITCTNVSALLTGLATARRQEIAIRLSLGAARGRLIRQLLTESALLAVLAGTAALGAVWLVLRTIMRMIPGMPFEVGLNAPITAFTFGVALIVGVLFGLSPALHATRLAIASVMRDSASTVVAARARLQRTLVVAQIAFTQPLIVLFAAMLLFLIRDFEPTSRSVLGDRLLTVALRPTTSISGSTPAAAESRRRLREATTRLLGRLEGTPGVEGATIDWRHAYELGPYVTHREEANDGVSSDAIRLDAALVSASWFEVTGVPLLRGRTFEAGEVSVVDTRADETAIIIGADLARRFWGNTDPVGRRLRAASDSTMGPRTLVVVGVIDDPWAERRQRGQDYRVFVPPDTSLVASTLTVRTAGSARPLVPVLRDIVQVEAPDLAAGFRTLAEIEQLQRRTFVQITTGLSAAGLAALLLSAIGLYAVVAFAVGQRTREIAVRMAVGARSQQIVRRFVGDGLQLGVIGLGLGLPVSLLGLGVLTSTVTDLPKVPLPAVTAIAMVGVLVVATLATWIPARRAAAVEPAEALRHE